MKRILSKHISEIIKKENEMNLAQSGWVSNEIKVTNPLILMQLPYSRMGFICMY